MCNEERKKRQLTMDGRCPSCNEDKETMEHVIRRCPKGKKIWDGMLGVNETNRTKQLNFRAWVDENLEGRKQVTCEGDWPVTFMVTAWWIWKWRNSEVFKGESYDFNQKMKWLMQQREEMKEAFAKMGDPGAAK